MEEEVRLTDISPFDVQTVVGVAQMADGVLEHVELAVDQRALAGDQGFLGELWIDGVVLDDRMGIPERIGLS